MIFDELAVVNIHNKGMIPWLNIMGPRYNISISWSIYNRLKEDPNVVIYLTNDDPVMRKLLEDRARAKKAAEDAKKLVVAEAVKIVDFKEDAPKVEERVSVEMKIPELYKETLEPKPVDESPEKAIDLEIEARLNNEVEEDDDSLVQPTEDDLAEIEANKNFKRYSQSDLSTKTKAQLKQILNIDRGFKPGDKYYGGYHDNLPQLIEFVLKSQ